MLIVCNFNMTPAASGTLEAGAKYQCIYTLFCGESLRQFDLLSADIESVVTLNVDYIIRVCPVLSPCKFAVKTEARNMPWNEKPRRLTVRLYAARLIDINGYLEYFPEATLTDNIGVTKLN